MKEYSFTYIQYKFSNLTLIPVCLLILILAECFEQLDNTIARTLYNIVTVFILVLIYNKISNKMFQRNGKINIVDAKQLVFVLGTKVTEVYIADIEKVILSVNRQFNTNHIELTIKTSANKNIKIVSKRYFHQEDLSEHAFMNVFYDIKYADPGWHFESDFDGTFLTLERKKQEESYGE